MKKQSKIERKKGNQNITVNANAIRTLRTLNNKEAFYFYEDVGKPTGESANSLLDFMEKIKSAKLESLVFHVKRRDFKTWAEKTLKDQKLAKKLAEIHATNNESLRAKIDATVRNRIKELEEASDTEAVLVDRAMVTAV
jgi:hypothetical protein